VSALELREVVKHYQTSGETVRAVDGVSLRIDPGELVALYGPSGSGKTTMLLLASALLAPDSGDVRFGEKDLADLSVRESSRYRMCDLGFVFQSFHLMAGATALDNAAIKLIGSGWRMEEARQEARSWLARVGLSGRENHRPESLSMGECQRVAIARALVNRPRLLLADEPTGNLDSVRSRDILELLRDICHEREIPGLIVTHDPQGAAVADRAHTLRDGHLTDGFQAELTSGSTVL
jgi:putative ABC transport system ATP-binding protein